MASTKDKDKAGGAFELLMGALAVLPGAVIRQAFKETWDGCQDAHTYPYHILFSTRPELRLRLVPPVPTKQLSQLQGVYSVKSEGVTHSLWELLEGSVRDGRSVSVAASTGLAGAHGGSGAHAISRFLSNARQQCTL